MQKDRKAVYYDNGRERDVQCDLARRSRIRGEGGLKELSCYDFSEFRKIKGLGAIKKEV